MRPRSARFSGIQFPGNSLCISVDVQHLSGDISSGVGKSYIACALAQKACRDGYSAFYTRAAALFGDLALARADGSFRNLLARLSRIDVLVSCI